MKRPAQHHFHVSLTSSVRTRLTLWYLAMVAFIMCLFGGSLYVTQTFLNSDAAESRLETQLYQDSQQFAQIYRQALPGRQALTALRLNQSSQEMVLLLRPDGSVLDARGPLTSSEIQQLRVRAEQNSEMIDLTTSQNHSYGWWARDTTYRVLITPVLNQTRASLLSWWDCHALIPSPYWRSGYFTARWRCWSRRSAATGWRAKRCDP